jgi:two-component system cell cycle sensor histidine kinase/response regulator CckA
MTENDSLLTRRVRHLWQPLVFLLGSCGVLLGIWLSLERTEGHEIEITTAVTSEQVALRLEAFIDSRIDLIEHVALDHPPTDLNTLTNYRKAAERYIAISPGFQAINWIDRDWVIRAIVPVKGNEPALGRNLHDHPSPDVARALTAAIETGRIQRTRVIDLLQGGTGFATYLAVRDADGDLLGFVNGVFRDDALIDACLSEKELRRQFRFVLLEEDGRTVYADSATDQFEEWPHAVRHTVKVVDRPWTLVLAPDPEVLAAAGSVADEVLLAAGLILSLLFAASLHALGKRQDELRLREAQYRLLVENQTDFIVKLDPEGRYLFVSPSTCETFGTSESELLGSTYTQLVHPDDLEKTDRVMKRLLRPPHSVYVEHRAMTKDGWRWIGWADTAVVDDGGGVAAIIGVGRDITERRRLEERLLQSQKVEAIGQLAGGVAHDFNNILQAVRGHLDIATGEIPNDHPALVHLIAVRTSVERATELTRQLLAFGRRQVMQPRLIDLVALVATTVGLLERVIGERFRIEVESRTDSCVVKADPQQLEQVLMNLTVNARDAMPGGGAITIIIDMVELDEATTTDTPWIRPGRFATLEVGDSGIGMDDSVRAQIFEPFFTTKPIGEGTGLGLAMVDGIVQQHDGFVTVDSVPGQGSRITVHLPLVDAPAPEIVEAPLVIASGGTETVLLAEDDASVRQVLEEMLTDAGYHVRTVTNGEEAIAELDRCGREIDIAILDVVMPGTGGLEVAAHLRASGSTVKLLFTSGYSPDLTGTGGDTDAPLLSKPFRRDELLRAVRQLLEQDPAS